jgi:hypothetical protein
VRACLRLSVACNADTTEGELLKCRGGDSMTPSGRRKRDFTTSCIEVVPRSHPIVVSTWFESIPNLGNLGYPTYSEPLFTGTAGNADIPDACFSARDIVMGADCELVLHAKGRSTTSS